MLQVGRKVRQVLMTMGGILVPALPAKSVPSLNIHLVPADFSTNCAAGGIDTLACNELEPNGDATVVQAVFVVVAGVDSIGGLQFGVQYPPTVKILAWQSCTQGVEIAQAGWPASNTGLATTWGGVGSPAETGTVIPVGYFLVDAGWEHSHLQYIRPRTRSPM